ncbi:MAG TPA: hypothetical protein VGB68_00855 [Pyrinomonadaceae bacterium]
MDTSELGHIIFSQSSDAPKDLQLREEILNLPDDNSEALKKLKEKLQSNYVKFFKHPFKDENFQQKWEKLTKLRNKIAHNNLFTLKDLQEGQQMFRDVLEIIRVVDKNLPNVIVSEEDLEVFQRNFDEVLFDISENEFLKRLKDRESYYYGSGAYVGLTNFINDHLYANGFDKKSSFEVYNKLLDKGLIEVYEVPGIYKERMVQAIKTTEDFENKSFI